MPATSTPAPAPPERSPRQLRRARTLAVVTAILDGSNERDATRRAAVAARLWLENLPRPVPAPVRNSPQFHQPTALSQSPAQAP